jgi:hypothetical protein
LQIIGNSLKTGPTSCRNDSGSAKSAILKERCFECGPFCLARSQRSVSPDALCRSAFKRVLSWIRPNTAVETEFRIAPHQARAQAAALMERHPRAGRRFMDTRPMVVSCGVNLQSVPPVTWLAARRECRFRNWHHPWHPRALVPRLVSRRRGHRGPPC